MAIKWPAKFAFPKKLSSGSGFFDPQVKLSVKLSLSSDSRLLRRIGFRDPGIVVMRHGYQPSCMVVSFRDAPQWTWKSIELQAVSRPPKSCECVPLSSKTIKIWHWILTSVKVGVCNTSDAQWFFRTQDTQIQTQQTLGKKPRKKHDKTHFCDPRYPKNPESGNTRNAF